MIQAPLLLLDFWAPWCAPCRAMLPSVQKLAAQHPELTLIPIHIEQQPELAEQFQVRSLPCLVLYQQGREVARTGQTLSFSQLQQWLAPFLNDEQTQLLAQAANVEGAEKLALLRQAVALKPADLPAQEALLSELALQGEDAELEQRLAALTAEQKRSPVLAQLDLRREFAANISAQPQALQLACLLAVQGKYEEALEELAQAQAANSDAESAQALMIKIVDIVPNRRQAHHLRRRWLTTR